MLLEPSSSEHYKSFFIEEGRGQCKCRKLSNYQKGAVSNQLTYDGKVCWG
jgi:hypothetical protein